MDALLQPLIIDRVFDFLGVFDMLKCQQVCKAWRESSLRRLGKSPPIDEFQALATCRYWYPGECQNFLEKIVRIDLLKFVFDDFYLNNGMINDQLRLISVSKLNYSEMMSRALVK